MLKELMESIEEVKTELKQAESERQQAEILGRLLTLYALLYNELKTDLKKAS